MNLLETYIFGRIVRMFFASLVPVLAIIWITQVLGRINLVTDSGQSIGSFAMLATYLLPTLIPIVMPFAVTIGVTQTLQTMNTDSEFAVIDAAGAKRSVLFKPALVLAAVVCVVSFSVDNFLEPIARHGMRKTIAATYADLLSSVIEEKTFRKIDDGLFVQISERVQGRVLRGLFVADSRNPAFEMLYYAREGAVDEGGGTLIMKDGEIHRKIRGGEVSVIHFDSYSFDLSELSASRGQATLKASDRDLFFLFNPDPNDAYFKESPNDFTAELHRRLTDWLFPVTFALISLMMAGSAHSHRERRLNPLLSSLFIAFLYRWITFYLANRIENGVSGALPLYTFFIATNVLMVVVIWRNANTLGRSQLFPRFADACIAVAGRIRPGKGDTEGVR
jgi:lipopolysaccharide export system permease protein